MSPFAGHTLTPPQRNFNYHVSLLRCIVERAFALWKGKWGIFWRPLRVAQTNIKHVVEVTARLHNFCIDRNCSTNPDDYAVYDDIFWTRTSSKKKNPTRYRAPPPPYTSVVFPDEETIAAFFETNTQDRAQRILRSSIMHYMEQQGYHAPLPQTRLSKERRSGLEGAVRAPSGAFLVSTISA